MLLTRFVAMTFCGCMLVTSTVYSQDYPNKPIRFVTVAPGGGGDFAARVIAQALAGTMGQPVIVENRSGSGMSAEVVGKAPPDGYTVLITGSTFWWTPLLRKSPWGDPLKDFSAVTLAASAPILVVVHPSVPVKSVKELIDLAKAKPGELNYGEAGIGSASHLGAELFKSMSKTDIVHVPYKASGPTIIALVGGQVQVSFATPASVESQVKSGKVRALAVTSLQPTALFPGLPTVATTLPGYEIASVQALFTPAKTPATVIRKLNQEIVRVLNRPEIKQKFFDSGVDVMASSPQELTAKMKSEMISIGKVIKDAGITSE